MKFDDWDWHIGTALPPGVPDLQGSVHIGMFLGWILDSVRESEILQQYSISEIDAFRRRVMTGSEVLRNACDGKLTDDDVEPSIIGFVVAYYGSDQYIEDYESVISDGLESPYLVCDEWIVFDKVKRMIDARFREWRIADSPTSLAWGPAPSIV